MDADDLKKSKLRRKAQEKLQREIDSRNNSLETEHELRVHQIELEVQNEELREAQVRLEELNSKYFDLYNSAPVGYFTLDKDGLILEANLTGASLLDIERINLHKMPFIRFIAPEDRNKFIICGMRR